ncbi:MAG: metallophosphoesterase family protein [Eubacterium sp.]
MLKFSNDNKFKIMHITDIQEIPNVSQDTLNLLNAALDSEKPDLVVLTGDQIKGYGISYKGSGDGLLQNVSATIKKIMEPITSRNIAFAVTFGNHDRQVGISNSEQLEKIYKALPNCIYDDKNAFDAGTYNIPIYSSDGKRIAFNLYLIDSGTDKKGGGYDPVSKSQIEWYKNTRESLKQNDKYIPSILFQHIPLCEYYYLLKKVAPHKPKSIRAYRTHKNEFYNLANTGIGNFLEPPSIPDVNTGEFDEISKNGDVLAVFVGHDHKNDFIGKYKNVYMGFTPSAGFNEYGNGLNRGVRIIELDENDIYSFATRIVTYKDLGFKKLKNPIKDFIYRHSPATMDAAKILIRNILIIIAIAVIFIAMLLW